MKSHFDTLDTMLLRPHVDESHSTEVAEMLRLQIIPGMNSAPYLGQSL